MATQTEKVILANVVMTGVAIYREFRLSESSVISFELKEGPVWQYIRQKLSLSDDRFCILESRERGFSEVKDAGEA
jgi:hypothetical protein